MELYTRQYVSVFIIHGLVENTCFEVWIVEEGRTFLREHVHFDSNIYPRTYIHTHLFCTCDKPMSLLINHNYTELVCLVLTYFITWTHVLLYTCAAVSNKYSCLKTQKLLQAKQLSFVYKEIKHLVVYTFPAIDTIFDNRLTNNRSFFINFSPNIRLESHWRWRYTDCGWWT